jgi:hypothetical protein
MIKIVFFRPDQEEGTHLIGLEDLIARLSAMKLEKHGTSLVKLVLSRRKSGLLQSVCPSQLSIFDIAQVSLGPRLYC